MTVAIQGDSLRVTCKSKDDLQQVIQLLKQEDLEVPLQLRTTPEGSPDLPDGCGGGGEGDA